MKKQCVSELFRYAFLNVLGMLGLSCYILADTYFISRWLGSDGLAALNLAIPVYNLVHGCGLMISMGGGVLYSAAQSREDALRSNSVFTHALLFWGLLSAAFMLTGGLFSDEIAVLVGAEGAVFSMTRIYLQMLLLCSPLFLLNDLLLGFIRNDGAPQVAMAGMLAGSFSNILLDYVFIFLLEWGMFGAVFATCLAPLISLAVVSGFFFRKKNRFAPVKLHPDRRLSGKLIAAGFPSLVTELSSGVVIVACNFLMLRNAGTTGVAAYGVVANLSLVIIAVFTGIAQGAQPVLSRYASIGDSRSLRLTSRCALGSTAVLAVLIYLFLFFGAGWTAGVFNTQRDAVLQSLAEEGIRLYFPGIIPAGLNIVLCMYFTCTDKPQTGNLLSVLRGFVLILPLAFLLAAAAGRTGLWLSFPVTEMLTLLLAAWYYRRSVRLL